MSAEDARDFCINCFFGSGTHSFLAELAKAGTPTEPLRRDVNGVGVIAGPYGVQQVAILLRNQNPYAQSAALTLARQTASAVTTIVVGEFQAIQPVVVPARQRVRPAPGGVSIGHYKITAGTLGCLVRDQGGSVSILSNNHVLANSNNANLLDPVYQPGPYDGGTSYDEIGKVSKWVPLDSNAVNYVDAAVATPNNPNDVRPDILNIGRVAGQATPALGLAVKKSGRTTGLTSGTIVILRAYVQVNYGPVGTLTFDDQIVIQPSGFSTGGDSGSLVVDQSNKAIGLLFAGSNTFTLVNPIYRVVQALNIASIL